MNKTILITSFIFCSSIAFPAGQGFPEEPGNESAASTSLPAGQGFPGAPGNKSTSSASMPARPGYPGKPGNESSSSIPIPGRRVFGKQAINKELKQEGCSDEADSCSPAPVESVIKTPPGQFPAEYKSSRVRAPVEKRPAAEEPPAQPGPPAEPNGSSGKGNNPWAKRGLAGSAAAALLIWLAYKFMPRGKE